MSSEDLSKLRDDALHRLCIRARRLLAARETTPAVVQEIERGEAAFRILYERYATRLFYYVKEEVLFAEEYHEFAEDATHSALLQLWMRDEPTEPGVDLWGLLSCYAHDRARDLVRSYAKIRSRRRPKGAPSSPVPAAEEIGEEHQRRQYNNAAPGQLEQVRESDPARPLEDQEIEDVDLRRILSTLPLTDRRIVEDHYLRRLTIEEIVARENTSESSETRVRRRIYQLLHRFRTRVRREHPKLPEHVANALERLEQAIAARSLEVPTLIEGLHQEHQERGHKRDLLADFLLVVSRLRLRVSRAADAREAQNFLEGALFRLRLRAKGAHLGAVVREQVESVAGLLGASEAHHGEAIRRLVVGLPPRDLVAVGRRLRRIGECLGTGRTRALATLVDLVLELQLRAGEQRSEVRQQVCERLLTRVAQARERAEVEKVLESLQGDERWRQVFKLVLRLERARRPAQRGQTRARVERIARC